MYVDRDTGNKIIGAFAREQYSGQEEISDTDPEYIIFRDGDPKDIRKEEITNQANALVDVYVGSDPRQQLKMVAAGLNMLDAQVGRGGNPSRDPRMDNLVGIFAYVEAVDTAEQDAYAAIDISSDPSTAVLVEPPLPGN